MKKILLAILLIIFSLVSKAVSKPNFIIIYLDDMGFSDVGLYKNEELNSIFDDFTQGCQRNLSPNL